MIWDRRRQKRNVLDEFAFIQIERDDGGRVLNVSEGGLSFEAFTPVSRNGPVHFWFSFNLRERIEAFGELAWTDATRKVGGLRFLGLSPQVREQIRTWARLTSKAENPHGDLASTVAPTFDDPSRQASKPDASMTSVSGGRFSNAIRLHGAFASESPDSAAQAVDAVHTSAESFDAAHLVPLERFLTATRRQFILGVLLGVLISSVVAIPAFKYSNNRKQVPASQAMPGSTAVTNSESQAGAPGTTPVPGAVHAALTASTTGTAQRSVQLGHPPDKPFGPAPAQPRLRSPQRSSGNQLTQTSSQPRPDDTKSSRKISATPQQLWSSVQAGNAKAALALADLYIRGDGVPVNCDQARVLLLVASEKRNADAIKKLRDLDKSGCPAP